MDTDEPHQFPPLRDHLRTFDAKKLQGLYHEITVEQAVVYSTSTTGLSTLTFGRGVVAGDGGVEERSEVMYCIEERTYIYYWNITRHSCIA